jgi:hypothetical protein
MNAKPPTRFDSRYYFDLDHECDTEHGDGLPECEVRVHFTFYPYQSEQGPSYASGGQPAEPASMEFYKAQKQVGGQWIDAPEFAEWASNRLGNNDYDIAMEIACADNDHDHDDARDDMIDRPRMEQRL